MPDERRGPDVLTREEAQERADRVRAFRAELLDLEREGALSLTAGQRASLDAYHESLVERLAGRFEVDRTEGQKKLSLAMRITSLLGAVALAASGYFLLYRLWGGMGSTTQVGVLVGTPLAALLAMELAARHERTLYLTLVAGVFAAVLFVTELTILAATLNVPFPPAALLLGAAFCLILAYAYGLRLLLAGGLLLGAGFVATFAGRAHLCVWEAFGHRPENFLPLGAALYATSLLPAHRDRPSFAATYRAVGLLCLFLPVLILSCAGHASYLRLGTEAIEAGYQLLGFTLTSLAIGLGIRRGEPESTNLGSGFFALLLYVKLVDWWWRWLPRWAFFLAVGLVTVTLLLALRRLHTSARRRSA